jgi:5'-nucleotidase (lipoprotein e(P4) family)
MSLKLTATAFVVLPLIACSAAASADGETSAAAQAADSTSTNPAPATPEPDTIHWVRDSSEYQAATRQAYALATSLIVAKASTHGGGDWGVIVDADETVLDNSQFEKEGWQQGVGYTPARWSAWVQRKEAKAVPGSAAFTQRVHALGGKVVVVTNRAAADCPATEENLQNLNVEFDLALCQTDPNVSDKNPRFQAVQAGTAAPGFGAVDVLMWLGDNILDFPSLSQSILTGGDPAYGDFADRFVIIPNPMYGSWQGNPVR